MTMHWEKVVAGRAARLAPLPFSDLEGIRDIDGLALEDQLPMAVVLAVGPEGGWSPRDREQLHAAGFEGLRLGPRILRTETAGIAAVAALQARWGDLR